MHPQDRPSGAGKGSECGPRYSRGLLVFVEHATFASAGHTLHRDGNLQQLAASSAIPAPQSALGSLPSVAPSSAQVTAIVNPTSGVGSEFTLRN